MSIYNELSKEDLISIILEKDILLKQALENSRANLEMADELRKQIFAIRQSTIPGLVRGKNAP